RRGAPRVSCCSHVYLARWAAAGARIRVRALRRRMRRAPGSISLQTPPRHPQPGHRFAPFSSRRTWHDSLQLPAKAAEAALADTTGVATAATVLRIANEGGATHASAHAHFRTWGA